MPRVPAKSLEGHVRDHRADTQSLAGEADVERLPDKTPAAVAADEITEPPILCEDVIAEFNGPPRILIQIFNRRSTFLRAMRKTQGIS